MNLVISKNKNFNLTTRLLAWEERSVTDGDGHNIGIHQGGLDKYWKTDGRNYIGNDTGGNDTGNYNSIRPKTASQPISVTERSKYFTVT